MPQAGGIAVEKLIYEVLSDEELLRIEPAGWNWSDELGRFVCTITSDPPPIRATRLTTEGKASTELVPAGPTLVAVPQFSESSVERIRAELESVLSGWVAHLELAEGIAIRFVYREAWLRVPGDGGGGL